MKAANVKAALGEYAEAVNEAIKEADRAKLVQRIWDRDASVWKTDEAAQTIISDSLGWLTVAAVMRAASDDLTAFANQVRGPLGFTQVMVCGMGGSSLCPEVMRQTFGRQSGFPELFVLDSTDPDALTNLTEVVDVAKCLFVIASKSGTTTEPLAFHRYWYDQVGQQKPNPGQSFVAITDPGTPLVQMAGEDRFRKIFLNQPDIGGRYSALSYFGMVPAALMGIDTPRFLDRADEMAELCRNHSSEENPAVRLGAIIGECAKSGRDKLTLVMEPQLAALGLWIEQLVAESTGKEGKGIVPVAGEPLATPDVYGKDRLFVSISTGPDSSETVAGLQDLEADGHPVVYLEMSDLQDLGAAFFLWELATAVAGWRLGINPFDQPNVQESKDATKELLEGFSREGRLREQKAVIRDQDLTVFADEAIAKSMPANSVLAALRWHLERAKRGDYIALLAYVEETKETDTRLQTICKHLRAATTCATTIGYGPRFLHSTGQLHKGGPDSGVFLQITAPDGVDLPIPGSAYSFGTLKQAQALGDFHSLASRGRRAIRVDLGANTLDGLDQLLALVTEALSTRGLSG